MSWIAQTPAARNRRPTVPQSCGAFCVWGAQAASLHLPAACWQASYKMVLGIPPGFRQAAETDRLAAAAPQQVSPERYGTTGSSRFPFQS